MPSKQSEGGEIKTTGNCIVHALTFCDDTECEWQADLVSSNSDMNQLRNSVKAHIRKTGHRVTVETGYTNTYFKEH